MPANLLIHHGLGTIITKEELDFFSETDEDGEGIDHLVMNNPEMYSLLDLVYLGDAYRGVIHFGLFIKRHSHEQELTEFPQQVSRNITANTEEGKQFTQFLQTYVGRDTTKDWITFCTDYLRYIIGGAIT